jgi:hypothetical protein
LPSKHAVPRAVSPARRDFRRHRLHWDLYPGTSQDGLRKLEPGTLAGIREVKDPSAADFHSLDQGRGEVGRVGRSEPLVANNVQLALFLGTDQHAGDEVSPL